MYQIRSPCLRSSAAETRLPPLELLANTTGIVKKWSGRVQEMSQWFEGVWPKYEDLGNKVHEITSSYEFFEYSSYFNKFRKLEIKETVFNKKNSKEPPLDKSETSHLMQQKNKRLRKEQRESSMDACTSYYNRNSTVEIGYLHFLWRLAPVYI